MSMMGESGKPSACESDVTGAISMLAASLAAQSPAALMDWNNNIRDDRNTCISLHCSNFPKSFFQSEVEIECLDVLGSTLGKENCFGAVLVVTYADGTRARFPTDLTWQAAFAGQQFLHCTLFDGVFLVNKLFNGGNQFVHMR